MTALRAYVHRAIIMSLLVGSTLVLINHGDHLMEEPLCPHFYIKLALCYLVPFSVSLVSAWLADRSMARARCPICGHTPPPA